MQWLLKKIIGTKNERDVKKLRPLVARVNELEQQLQSLSEDALKAKTAEFKERLAKGQTPDDILCEAFAVGEERLPPPVRHGRSTSAATRCRGTWCRSTCSSSAASSCTRARSPKWPPARARRWSPPCRSTSTRSPARTCTWSPSTTTWPAATRSGWARSTSTSASRSAASRTR